MSFFSFLVFSYSKIYLSEEIQVRLWKTCRAMNRGCLEIYWGLHKLLLLRLSFATSFHCLFVLLIQIPKNRFSHDTSVSLHRRILNWNNYIFTEIWNMFLRNFSIINNIEVIAKIDLTSFITNARDQYLPGKREYSSH